MTSPVDAPAMFGIAAAAYGLLPAKIREIPRVAHYSSVLVGRLMPPIHSLVSVDGSILCLNIKHPADLQRAWGVWEPDLRRYLVRTLRPGMTFVDVGAHRGTYTMLAARLVGAEGKVIAVEPFPEHAESLEIGVRANGYKHVVLHRAGAGRVRGLARLTIAAPHIDDAGEISVPILPIDEISPDGADLVKIDTDGEEVNVVHGMRGVLERGARVVIEFSDFSYQSAKVVFEEISEILGGKGYRPEFIDSNGVTHPMQGWRSEYAGCHVVYSRAS